MWLSHMEVPLYFNILWGCRIKDAGDILYSKCRWLKSGGLGSHKRSKTKSEPEELQNVQMELRAKTEKNSTPLRYFLSLL